MSSVPLFDDHFLLSSIVDLVSNIDSRALLCVCKAATSIKQQSPVLYEKMRTHHAALVITQYDIQRAFSTPRVLFHEGEGWSRRFVPLDIELPVIGEYMRCGNFPLFSANDQLPAWTWRALDFLMQRVRPCGFSWVLHDGEGETFACKKCARFRTCVLAGDQTETENVAKKLKLQ